MKGFKLKNKEKIKDNKPIGKTRLVILILILVMFSIFTMRHYILGGGVAPSVDALCPFGGFETLGTLISTGGFVPQIVLSSLVLAIITVVLTLILRRGFCGYVCPFGTVQELLYKIKSKRVEINEKLDAKGRYIKYFILAGILIGTFITGRLIFKNSGPFSAFFHFGKGLLWDYEATELIPNLISFSKLLLLLFVSVFISRFYCKYMCPLGAAINIFAKFSPTRLVRSTKGKNKCIDCKICDKVCPMNIKPSIKKEIKTVECISCNQCVNVCPKGSLSIDFFKKTMKVSLYLVLVLLIFFGSIGVAKLSDNWQSIPSLKPLDEGGELNPDDIKGWMTLNDVSVASGMELLELERRLEITHDMSSIPMKDIKNTFPEFETDVVREIIKSYNEHQEIYGEEDCQHSQGIVPSPEDELECPWGLINDTIPRCALHEDSDGNGICDLSE